MWVRSSKNLPVQVLFVAVGLFCTSQPSWCFGHQSCIQLCRERARFQHSMSACTVVLQHTIKWHWQAICVKDNCCAPLAFAGGFFPCWFVMGLLLTYAKTWLFCFFTTGETEAQSFSDEPVTDSLSGLVTGINIPDLDSQLCAEQGWQLSPGAWLSSLLGPSKPHQSHENYWNLPKCSRLRRGSNFRSRARRLNREIKDQPKTNWNMNTWVMIRLCTVSAATHPPEQLASPS